MSEALRTWILEELDRRKWSRRELARQADLSHSFINRVLSGNLGPSVNFCHKIATALNESPEKLLRLAGILPAAAPDDATLTELQDLVNNLTPEQRQEAIDYMRFLQLKRH